MLFVTGTISEEQIKHILKTLVPVFADNVQYYSDIALITISYNKLTDPLGHLTKILKLFHNNNIKTRAILQGTTLTTFEVVVNQEQLESSLILLHNELYPAKSTRSL